MNGQSSKGSLFPCAAGYSDHFRPERHRKISYLPPQESLQGQGLPPLQLAECSRFKMRGIESIKAMLANVGLNDSFLSRQFNELSTGQFQRMMIAWSLRNNPDVLVLNEPTSGIPSAPAIIIVSVTLFLMSVFKPYCAARALNSHCSLRAS